MEVKHEAFIPFSELQEIIERHLNSQGYQSIPNSIVGLVSGDNGGCTVKVKPLSQPAPKPEPTIVEQQPEPAPAKKTYKHTDHYTQAEERKRPGRKPGKLLEQQEARNQVVKERVAELKQGLTLEVEPEQKWPAMPVKTAEHVHDWKYYPSVAFTDPEDPDHKHTRRMCRTCGENNEVACKTCQALEEEKAWAQKEQKPEVVAPSPATFPTTSETAAAR